MCLTDAEPTGEMIVTETIAGTKPEETTVVDDSDKYLRYAETPTKVETPAVVEDKQAEKPPVETPPKREVDKDLQQIQQQIATQQKQLEALVAAKTPEEKAKANAALEKTKGRLDSMLKLAGGKPDEIDPFTGTAQVAEAAHAALEGVSASNAQQQQLDARLAQVEAAQRSLAAERRTANFERANPELAGKFDELSAKARDATNEFFGDDAAKVPDSAWAKMAAKQMEELVAAEKSKTATAQPPKPAVKPGGSTSTVVKNGLPPVAKFDAVQAAKDADAKYLRWN